MLTRKLWMGVLLCAVSTACAQQWPTPNRPVLPAQQAPTPEPSTAPTRGVIPAQDGGVREVLESIVVPPIPHEPFTATLITEWVRYTPDGASITLINQRRIARDAQGRLYEERWALVPKNGDIASRLQWIQIADAHTRTLYNCNMIARVCELLRYDPARDLAAATAPSPSSGPLPGDRGFSQTESLGTRMIAGVDTMGTRVTTTLNPGAVGNDRPVVKTERNMAVGTAGGQPALDPHRSAFRYADVYGQRPRCRAARSAALRVAGEFPGARPARGAAPFSISQSDPSELRQDQRVELQELAQHLIAGALHFLHGAEELRAPLMQEKHAIREPLREAHIVGHHDAGQAQLTPELLNEVAEQAGDQRIDHSGGLVVQNRFRLRGQGTRNRHRSLGAGGEVRGQQVDHLRDAHHLQQPADDLLDLILGEAAAFAQREGDVLADGERIEERAVLENHGDFAAHHLHLRSVNCVMSSPATRMRPESGRRKPMISCSETDLPTPERPRMQSVSPGIT